MSMKKVLCAVIALFACFTLSQKTTICSVYDDLEKNRDSVGNDSKIGALVLEYFKSELATHSGIKVTLPEPTSAAIEKSGMKKGAVLSKEQISSVCKKTGSSVFCAVSLLNDYSGKDVKRNAVIRIFDANGNLLNEVKQTFFKVEEADYISIKLAQEAATVIRGKKDVDSVNEQRMTNLVKRNMIASPSNH